MAGSKHQLVLSVSFRRRGSLGYLPCYSARKARSWFCPPATIAAGSEARAWNPLIAWQEAIRLSTGSGWPARQCPLLTILLPKDYCFLQSQLIPQD
jgi:hypothetical protein